MKEFECEVSELHGFC